MNITAFESNHCVFHNVELIHGCAFSKTALEDLCALLLNICSGFTFRQVKCAHLSCFECLMPRAGSAC